MIVTSRSGRRGVRCESCKATHWPRALPSAATDDLLRKWARESRRNIIAEGGRDVCRWCRERLLRQRARFDLQAKHGHLHGCCVDLACSRADPTKPPCMALGDGLACKDCVHMLRCTSIFGAKPENTYCQFFPSRFRAAGGQS